MCKDQKSLSSFSSFPEAMLSDRWSRLRLAVCASVAPPEKSGNSLTPPPFPSSLPLLRSPPPSSSIPSPGSGLPPCRIPPPTSGLIQHVRKLLS
ncbi:hypothetical protein ACRRTK_023196 [Alexandromys fortis]